MDYNLGTARGRIEIDSSGAERSIEKTRDAQGRFVKGVKQTQTEVTKATTKTQADLAKQQQAFVSSLRNQSAALSTIGKKQLAVGASVLAGFGFAINKAIDFEHAVSQISAVSGATEKQLESLRKKALQLGADTVFSASEAANAMEELAKAGISVEDILGGAADAAVALAAAGGIGIPEAATIAANAMNAFNLEAKDLNEVVDLISGAANASAIDVTDFGISLQQSGAVANIAGVEFSDLATAIALLGNAGIKGSDAGTSLRTMLLNLNPTTKKQIKLAKELGIITKDGANQFFDAEGKAKGLADVAGVLQDALRGMTDQQKLATLEILFGTDAIRAAAILSEQGADGFNKLASEMAKVKAADVARKRLDNVRGSLEQLKGSFETFLIVIGEIFLPILKQVVDALTAVFNVFSDLPSGVQKTIAILAVVVASLVTLSGVINLARAQWLAFRAAMATIGIIQGTTAAVGGLTAATAASGTAAAGAGARFALLPTLLNPVAIGAVAVAAGLYLITKRADPTKAGLDRVRDATDRLNTAEKGLKEAQQDTRSAQKEVNRLRKDGKTDTDAYRTAVQKLTDAEATQGKLQREVFSAQRDQLGGVTTAIESLLDKGGAWSALTLNIRDSLQQGDETTTQFNAGILKIAKTLQDTGIGFEAAAAQIAQMDIPADQKARVIEALREMTGFVSGFAAEGRSLATVLGPLSSAIPVDALAKQKALLASTIKSYADLGGKTTFVKTALKETVATLAEHNLAYVKQEAAAGRIVDMNALMFGSLQALKVQFPGLGKQIDKWAAKLGVAGTATGTVAGTNNALLDTVQDLAQRYPETSQALAGMLVTLSKLPPGNEAGKKTTRGLIAELRALQDKFPALRDVIDGYIGRVKAIPDKKKTVVEADTGEAMADVRSFRDYVEDQLQDITVKVFVEGVLVGIRSSGGFTPLAAGGPAQKGSPYWVGEEGPELFFPDRSGTVVPSAASKSMTGGGSVTINTKVNIVNPPRDWDLEKFGDRLSTQIGRKVDYRRRVS